MSGVVAGLGQVIAHTTVAQPCIKVRVCVWGGGGGGGGGGVQYKKTEKVGGPWPRPPFPQPMQHHAAVY